MQITQAGGRDPLHVVEHWSHRETEILDALRRFGSCRTHDLARRLDVSEETIRRNVKRLAERGLVTRMHGGVELRETGTEAPFNHRMQENVEAKEAIATAAALMIRDGESLFLDIGSTAAYVARALRHHRNLFIVTNALSVVNALVGRNDNRVFFAGGELRVTDGSALGDEALRFVQRFNFECAILTASGISAEAGFTLHDPAEATIALEVARKARRRIMVADASKFGHTAPMSGIPADQIDSLVTNAPPPGAIAGFLARHDIRVVVAGADDAVPA